MTRLTSGRLIPGLDKSVCRLALGTAGYNLAEKARCFELLDTYLQLGGTIIDTGRAYGESEAVIGEWLESRQVREQVVLATKCAHGADALLPATGFEEVVTQEVQESLAQLHTDYVDIYLLHRDNTAVPVGRIMERMNRELERGTAKSLGASNWSYARVDEANAYASARQLQRFAVVSNNLSLAAPLAPFYPRLVSVDAAGERWHEERRVPLLSWSAQARGFFAGACHPAMRAQYGQHQAPFVRRMIEVYGSEDNEERLRRARELGAARGGYSAVQVALAWLLHKPFPLVAIVGPRSVEELVSCVEATELALSDRECSWLNLAD